MKTTLVISTIFILFHVAQPLATLAPLSAADKQAIVNGINSWRASLSPTPNNMLQITWSDSIARFSESWASKCIYKHSTQAEKNQVVPPVNGIPVLSGENIAWSGSTVSTFPSPLSSVLNAQKRWRDEVSFYNYNANTCSGVCGHYVMEAWATATKIGCAVAHCKPLNLNGVWQSTYNYQYVICNYDKIPFSGQRPYSTGPTTSPTVTTRPPTVTTRPPTVTTRPPTVTTRPPTVTTRPPTVTTRPPTTTLPPSTDPTVKNIIDAMNSFRVSQSQSSLSNDDVLKSAIQRFLVNGGSFDFASTGTKFSYTYFYTFYPRITVTNAQLLADTSFTSKVLNNGRSYTHHGVFCTSFNSDFKKCGFALGEFRRTVLEDDQTLEYDE